MIRRAVVTTALSLAFVGAAGAAPIIVIGEHKLLPDTPGQTVTIEVSAPGEELVLGCELNAQVGDGGPELGGTPAPAITSVDLENGTIFDGLHDGQFDLGSVPQLATWSIDALYAPDGVPADGLLVTLTVDTTGFTTEQQWPLALGNTLNGPTYFLHPVTFDPIIPDITDGAIKVIPEPMSLLLLAAAVPILRRRRR